MGFHLSAADIGVEVKVILDPLMYTDDEEAEIGEMLARVLDAWYRRRATTLRNPGIYGIRVH